MGEKLHKIKDTLKENFSDNVQGTYPRGVQDCGLLCDEDLRRHVFYLLGRYITTEDSLFNRRFFSGLEKDLHSGDFYNSCVHYYSLEFRILGDSRFGTQSGTRWRFSGESGMLSAFLSLDPRHRSDLHTALCVPLEDLGMVLADEGAAHVAKTVALWRLESGL